MWETCELQDFGWRKSQWKEWTRLWKENGSMSPRCMTDDEWEVISARMQERKKVATPREERHDAFYGVVNASRDVLTPEQEDESARFKRWLESLEDASEITGV